MAILDFTTCSNFQSDADWIARRLGLSKEEVCLALEVLEKEKLLVHEEGVYKKVINDLVVPTLSSREKIRQYHKTMSLKAIHVMESQTSTEDFNKRLIKGATIAVNPAQLERAKDMINKALEEIIEKLTEGDCTELYHFNLQLYPLLQPESGQ
jgi:uncharacterized protein (TIGR02147 family)